MVEYPILIGPFQRADNKKNSIKKILKEKKKKNLNFFPKNLVHKKGRKKKLFKILKSEKKCLFFLMYKERTNFDCFKICSFFIKIKKQMG
jgi:hypothetical protein